MRKIIRRGMLILFAVTVIYLLFVPSHGETREIIRESDGSKHTDEYLMIYKPWKADDIVEEIEERKAMLGETPDTMTIHMYLFSKGNEYKTINITYN